VGSDEVVVLGLQFARGLGAAHGQGIIHRDLKPANLRLTADGRLKILDFGLAQFVHPEGDLAATASLTSSQQITGTLPYMSPEQLRGEFADRRTDILAMGAVLYELATGKRPFRAHGFMLIMPSSTGNRTAAEDQSLVSRAGKYHLKPLRIRDRQSWANWKVWSSRRAFLPVRDQACHQRLLRGLRLLIVFAINNVFHQRPRVGVSLVGRITRRQRWPSFFRPPGRPTPQLDCAQSVDDGIRRGRLCYREKAGASQTSLCPNRQLAAMRCPIRKDLGSDCCGFTGSYLDLVTALISGLTCGSKMRKPDRLCRP
jgi:serine/threonine protein kinase